MSTAPWRFPGFLEPQHVGSTPNTDSHTTTSNEFHSTGELAGDPPRSGSYDHIIHLRFSESHWESMGEFWKVRRVAVWINSEDTQCPETPPISGASTDTI
jgi:hypothetical protein